jgi:hypothetical protein
MGEMANKSIGKGQNRATLIQNQYLANKFYQIYFYQNLRWGS